MCIKQKSLPLLRSIPAVIVLIAVPIFIYWQVGHFSFINFDDPLYVENNQFVQKGITFETITWAFTGATNITNFWAPLTWLSIMLDYQVYGMNAGGYHLTNLIFHVLSSLLILAVFYKMTRYYWRSLFIAALFALHPQHVESVAWVTERKDVLSAFFWILTMLAYSYYSSSRKISVYLITLICFVLGLMSKPMLVTLPFALLLLDFWPLNRFQFSADKKNIKTVFTLLIEKLPLFLIIIISSIAAFITQDQGNALPSISQISPLLRIENAFISYSKYIWKTIWPFNLSVSYLFPRSISIWPVTASFLFILCVSSLICYLVKRFPWLFVGWFWYLGTLVPVIGFVVIADQAMADRYTYIPHIGLFIIVSWGIPNVLQRLHYRTKILTVTACAFLAFMSIITANQIRYWKNSETLFQHAIEVNGNHYLAYNNLGLFYQGQGNIKKAITLFEKSIQAEPKYFSAYNNLGVAVESIGNARRAIALYKIAIMLKPDFTAPYINLAFILLHTGEIEHAISYSQKALLLDPEIAEAYIVKGDAYKKKVLPTKSIQMYQKALQINAKSTLAHSRIADAYLQTNQLKKAIFHLEAAVRLDPLDKNFRDNLNQARSIKDKLLKQIAITKMAIDNSPSHYKLYNKLGLLYKKNGDINTAIACFSKALSYDDDFTPALFNIADAYIEKKKFSQADLYIKTIITLHPGESIYSYNIGCLYSKKGDVTNAISWLLKAVNDGYTNQNNFEMDKDLENIRETTAFKNLLTTLKKKNW